MPNAGHWVRLDDGRTFFYQTLNSCAYDHKKYEKLYIGPGATIELPSLWRELEENNVPAQKLGISPLTSILQDIDGGYEKGTHDFSGTPYDEYDADAWCLIPEGCRGNTRSGAGGPLAATGTTAHGCGANRARRVLRRKEARYAKDIPELQKFLCDVPGEIMGRLDRGQSGLLSVAQGFALSYMLPQFFPMTTSRNCTVAAGLDDMMVAPYYAGPVILNFRTFPIRINSNKYIEKSTGRHLTWDEYQEMKKQHEKVWRANNKSPVDINNLKGPELPYRVVEGNSGPGYPDQEETSWESVTGNSGSPEPITEMTSVTKLPRRVFTFSRQNMFDAIRHNRTGHETYVSVNFINYVDHATSGMRGVADSVHGSGDVLTDKARRWLLNNMPMDMLRFIGTGPKTDDKILVNGSKRDAAWPAMPPG